MNAYLYAKTPYDALTDFVPVSSVAINPLLLVVHPSVPAKSVAELIALAKAKPGQLNYGSGGIGSTPFLADRAVQGEAGIDIMHVPYKGGAPALADLAAGQLSMMIENMPGTHAVRARRQDARARHHQPPRSPLEPELPTMIEAGVPDYEMIGWNGFFFPKGTRPRSSPACRPSWRRCWPSPRSRNSSPRSAPRRSATARKPSPLSSRERDDALGQADQGPGHQA